MASDLRLGSEDVSKEKSIMGMDSSGSEALWSSCSLRLRTVEEEEEEDLQGIDDSSSDLTLAGFGTGTRLLTEASILGKREREREMAVMLLKNQSLYIDEICHVKKKKKR